MRFYIATLPFLLAACTPDPPRDTTADTQTEVVYAPETDRPAPPQDATSDVQYAAYGGIPKASWLNSPATSGDTKGCTGRELFTPDRTGLKKIMGKNAGSLMACYKEGLGRDIKLRGKVTLRFLVRSDGTVRSCAVKRPLADPQVGTCMCTKVLTFAGFKGPSTEGCLAGYNYTLTLIPPD